MALAMNIVLFVIGLIGCIGEYRRYGNVMFKYYTFLSNIIGTIAAAVMAIVLIIGKEAAIYNALVFKYLATACLTLTFLVVIFVLAPTAEKGYMSQIWFGSLKFQHLFCPLLAAASFLITDPKLPLPLGAVVIAWLPTLVYAIVTVILNILRLLDGPYGFLKVHNQPWWASVLWFVGIVGFQFLIVWGMAIVR